MRWTVCVWSLSVTLSAGPCFAQALPAPTTSQPASTVPYGGCEPLPIDLPTTLQLVNANNPTVALARARVREAQARLQEAQVLMLPTLSVGTTYLRHDGQIQNSTGNVFTTSRSSLFNGGSAQLRVDLADALFLPLVGRRLLEAEAAFSRAVNNDVQLEAASAYLDLLQVHAALAINADTLARAEQMLDRAKVADEVGQSKTKGDVNRARTEVELRRQERLDLQGRAGAASARLARLLLLEPTVDLLPADPDVVPVVLVPPGHNLDELVQVGLSNRPEVAANAALLAAAAERVRQARLTPVIPKMQLEYTGGGFGGGRNDDIINYNTRGDFGAGIYWEARNLGFGNVAQVRERQAQADQQTFRAIEIRARVGAEISESAKLAGAHFQTLEAAQEAVRQATELYRKLLESSFGMLGQDKRYDAIEPLLAIQALNQARVQYLTEVIEFNRAQFRLFTAMGSPAECALAQSSPQPVATPAGHGNPP